MMTTMQERPGMEAKNGECPSAKSVAVLASKVRTSADEQVELEDTSSLTPTQILQDQQLDQLCEAWAHWCATRGYYGPPPLGASVLGKLQKRMPTLRARGGPDAPCSARILAFHLAILGQGENALDCKVFRLHYLYRVKNVKAAASLLQISRQHWYRLLREFRRRAYRASLPILDANMDERARMGVEGVPDDCVGAVPGVA